MILTLVSFVIIFCILVIVHEFGHFITARLCGVRIHEFSVGMGPVVLKKQGPETLYALRAIPLGGYVKMEGEDEESTDERSFSNRKPWQRLIILAAGAIMNFVLAFVLLLILGIAIGAPSNTVGAVVPDAPAAASGLVAGDKITSVNEIAVDSWEGLTEAIQASNGEALVLDVVNGTERKVVEIEPEKDANGRYVIGIQAKYEKDFGKAFENAGKQFKTFFMGIFEFLSRLGEKEIREGVSGPVGIVSAIGQASKMGILNLILVAAYISVNLGIFNLLPFPALDGGRIVFVLIEMIKGKPIDREKEGYVHFVGIVLLLMLTVFLTFRDIQRF